MMKSIITTYVKMKLWGTVWSLYTIEEAASFLAFMIVGWKESHITMKLWRCKLIKYMNFQKVKKDHTQVKYALKNVISTCAMYWYLTKLCVKDVSMESVLLYSNL